MAASGPILRASHLEATLAGRGAAGHASTFEPAPVCAAAPAPVSMPGPLSISSASVKADVSISALGATFIGSSGPTDGKGNSTR